MIWYVATARLVSRTVSPYPGGDHYVEEIGPRWLWTGPCDVEPPESSNYDGSGYSFVASPDGTKLAFSVSSLIWLHWFHTVSVWDEEARRVVDVVSIREGDPGSGFQHGYEWSTDSEVLFVTGGGFVRGHGHEPLLLYFTESDQLFSVPRRFLPEPHIPQLISLPPMVEGEPTKR